MYKLHWSTLFGNIFFMQDEERCWGSNRGTLQIPSQVWGHQTLFSYWWCLQGGHWDILCHGQRWHLWGSYTSWLYVQPSFLLNVTYNPEMLLSKNCIDYWQYVFFFLSCFHSKATEDLPGLTGYDSLVRSILQNELWNLPRQCPRSVVQEWTTDPAQWPYEYNTQK